MDFIDIKQKYPLAFQRYLNFSLITTCRNRNVSLGSSDILEAFFDNHGLFPLISVSGDGKKWEFSVITGEMAGGKPRANYQGYRDRQHAKGAMYKKCFHIIEMRLIK